MKRKLAVAVAGTAAVAYGFWLRRRLRDWGTTVQDRSGRLPGDDMVADVSLQITQAVDIAAPPADVWPWLAQIGQGRGGFYSYDWLENLLGCDIHSAERIVEAWQDPRVGDEVRLIPPRQGGMEPKFEVLMVDPPHSLVLVTPGTPSGNREEGLTYGTWAFALQPVPGGGTHLVARSRYEEWPSTIGRLIDAAMEISQCVMQRKMLLGIKQRAEGEARHPRIVEHPHIVVPESERPPAWK